MLCAGAGVCGGEVCLRTEVRGHTCEINLATGCVRALPLLLPSCGRQRGGRGPATERGRAALRPLHAHDTRTCARAALLPLHTRSSCRRRSSGTPLGLIGDTYLQSAYNAQARMQHTKHSRTRSKHCTRTRAEDPLGYLLPVRRRRPSACSARRTARARARRRANALGRQPPVRQRRSARGTQRSGQ